MASAGDTHTRLGVFTLCGARDKSTDGHPHTLGLNISNESQASRLLDAFCHVSVLADAPSLGPGRPVPRWGSRDSKFSAGVGSEL